MFDVSSGKWYKFSINTNGLYIFIYLLGCIFVMKKRRNVYKNKPVFLSPTFPSFYFKACTLSQNCYLIKKNEKQIFLMKVDMALPH